MSQFPWEREILNNKAVIRYDGFEWRFDGEDLNIFKNAKTNDVIRSRHFEKNKCIFFLECTPNGWSKTPDCNVWCAVSALPSGIFKVEVQFTYSCTEVGYRGEKTQTLGIIKNRTGRSRLSTTTLTNTTLSQYKNLKSFSYKLQIKVLRYYNKNGQVVDKKNIMQYGDMIQELIAKNLSLEQALDTACAHNTELHSQVNHLNSKLAKYELKDKNNEIYIRDSVFLYDTKDKQCINPREDIERHQKVINDVVMEHNATMREWLIETGKMSKLYTQCKHNLDEEKTDSNTSLLLSSYIQCKQLWQQQQNKMESITGILSRLTAQKKQLKISVAGHDKKAKVTSSAYQQELQKYEESGQNRKKLEQDLQETLIRLNNEIDIENKVNKRQCELLDEYNTFDVELTKYKLISKDCKKLIKQYNEFDAMSEQTIGDMQKYFDVKWIECMKVWYQWDPQSIICWIKYLEKKETQQLMLSHAVNLDKILEEMVKNQIDGEALLNIEKEMLHSIGFEELNDRNKMYDKIRKLISKYPHPSVIRPSDSNNKVSESKFEIPEEYLCPHSKTIMMNPVQIFDGYTYEKSAIEAYLKKEKKSPVTGEECDEDDIWFTKNRKLKAKIVAFLSVNPQL